jgi:hypothetical protein
MVHRQAAKDGDGFHIRWVAASLLNKQSWTADNGWCSSFRTVEEGLTSPHHKISACNEMLHRALDFRTFVNTVMNLHIP